MCVPLCVYIGCIYFDEYIFFHSIMPDSQRLLRVTHQILDPWSLGHYLLSLPQAVHV